ncbi:MAG: DUF4097 domain-containing protein [Ruminococcaceae bacterium]|nr:DUF4097 domain-containing protein [Oscillospiraceae bacterium]
MKTVTKILLAIAAAALIIGVAVGLCGLFMMNFDLNALQTQEFLPVVHEVTGEFSDISIRTIESSIEFKRSDDGTCYVECMESELVTYSVEIKDGALRITVNDQRRWYNHVGIFNTQRQNLTVYLPGESYDSLQIESNTGAVLATAEISFSDVQIELDTGAVAWEANVSQSMKIEGDTGLVQVKNATMNGELRIKTSTGRVELRDVKASNVTVETSTGKAIVQGIAAAQVLRVSVTTGNAELSDCTAAEIRVQTTTGKAKLSDVVASGRMEIEASTGDVQLDSCDAAEMQIETDTGDVTGSIRTPKVIFARSDTGRIRVPKSTTGGICDISTDTGDIIIDFEQS